MAFRVSPGVSIKEIDLTTIVPAVATTPGGYAGYFHWGPVDEIVTVTQETELANIFGKPQNNNYIDFYTVANFLGYGNNMQVVRVVGTDAKNANAVSTGASSGRLIKNETAFLAGVTNGDAEVLFSAKYPGVLGNSLKVAVLSGNGLQTGFTLTAAGASLGATRLQITLPTDRTVYLSSGDDLVFIDGTQATISGVVKGSTTQNAIAGDFFGITGAPGLTLTLSTPLTRNYGGGFTFSIRSVYSKYVTTTARTTEYAAGVGGTGDLVNILVLDKDGQWTGTQNSLLEKFEGLSRSFDARAFDGSSNYYKTVVNDRSAYIWALRHELKLNGLCAASSTFPLIGAELSVASAVGQNVSSFHLGGGTAPAPTDSDLWANGWSKFQDADEVDVSLLPLGNASANLARLVVQNVCEKRLDCMAFISPAQTDVENKLPYEALNSLKTFRDDTLNINSSYAVIDSGWKYQLDTYNNLVRVVPVNPDIAGLVARTEFTNEAWFSPAGFNRGQIKNVVKLAYNPSSEAHRDELYTRQINPVVSFPGEGVILFGDKTAQTRPSAFDRINVRRLFIVLEKAIATASKFFLFEQNDAFTRAQFRNLVVPFLKTVQQRRGITDFKVVCDETNNTGEVIDRNEFVADIFIKPTRSINFISLNFIATKTGVSFSEVGG